MAEKSGAREPGAVCQAATCAGALSGGLAASWEAAEGPFTLCGGGREGERSGGEMKAARGAARSSGSSGTDGLTD